MSETPSANSRFRMLFDEHHDAMQRYCRRRLPSSEVNDALAEVFLVTWRRLSDIPQGDQARMWLYGAARNVVRNVERRLQRTSRLTARIGYQVVPDSPVDSQLVRRAEERRVVEALAALPEKDREILRLKAWEELSNVDIGTLLAASPRAVAMRYNRALKKLRRALTSVSRAATGLASADVVKGGEW